MGEVGAFFSRTTLFLLRAVSAAAQNFGGCKLHTKEANEEKLLIALTELIPIILTLVVLNLPGLT